MAAHMNFLGFFGIYLGFFRIFFKEFSSSNGCYLVKHCEENSRTYTTNYYETSTTTTNHETPHPSDEIQKIWGKIMKQTAKTTWQHSYGHPGQHLSIEDWKAQRTVINRAMKAAIATNRSIKEHDAKLREMELKWCCERPGTFPDHIRITFTTVRSRLEAHDAKRAGQTRTAIEYESADFEGSRNGEDKEGQREQGEEMGKRREEKEEEKGEEEEEEERAKEGDEQVADALDDTNDVVMMS